MDAAHDAHITERRVGAMWARDNIGLFDLPGCRVIDAVDRPGQRRQVIISAIATEAPCPWCGVLARRVHQRRRQRLADVPVAGPVGWCWVSAASPARTAVRAADVRRGQRRSAAAVASANQLAVDSKGSLCDTRCPNLFTCTAPHPEALPTPRWRPPRSWRTQDRNGYAPSMQCGGHPRRGAPPRAPELAPGR
jgi:hypothetical protein